MKFDDIITIAEAGERWGLGEATLRRAISFDRFTEREVKKSGRVWLITLAAMERVYGPEPEDPAKVRGTYRPGLKKRKSFLKTP